VLSLGNAIVAPMRSPYDSTTVQKRISAK